ncbi:MAG: hypothetical protein IKO71_01505, partial [Bacteroidaceae bacterium]|nr:hypothetical protein [Bacteroidaceae bacterium]
MGLLMYFLATYDIDALGQVDQTVADCNIRAYQASLQVIYVGAFAARHVDVLDGCAWVTVDDG